MRSPTASTRIRPIPGNLRVVKRGYWEQEGNNPAIAALVTTALVLALYFAFSGIPISIVLLAQLAKNGSGFAFDFGTEFIRRNFSLIHVTTMVCQALFFGAVTLFVFRKWHGLDFPSYAGLSAPKPLPLVASIAGIAGLFPVIALVGELFTRAFPFLREIEDLSAPLYEARTPAAWIILVLSVCLTPAIWEELLFRGYFHRTLSRKVAAPLSWMLSGTIFALVHQNYFGLLALVIVGCYLGFVYDRTRNVWTGSVVHFLYNGAIILIANKPGAFSWLVGPDGLTRTITLLFSLPVAAAGIACLFAVTRAAPNAAQGPIPATRFPESSAPPAPPR